MMDTADHIDPNQLCPTPDIDVAVSVFLVCRELFLAGTFARHSIYDRSMEQDCKSRALPLVAPSDSQFTADPFDKRPNNGHSQSFADGWIKSIRQRRHHWRPTARSLFRNSAPT
jgi:hypothetical protein